MSNTEIWKDIKDYEGYYQVSSFGNVRSMDRTRKGKGGVEIPIIGIVLKSSIHKNGSYNQVCLRKDGIKKLFLIHRLVAIAFIENPFNYKCVCHKVESIPSNDNVDNLWWGTQKMNIIDMVKKKRGADRSGDKNGMFGRSGENCPSFGRKGDKHPLFGLKGSSHPAFGLKGSLSKSSKLVLDVQTGIFYECVREAAEAKNIGYGYMSRMLSGERKNKTSLIYV